MNQYLCLVILIFSVAVPVSFSQDGNNYSDQYRQDRNSKNYSRDYRDNYRNNPRLRSTTRRPHNPFGASYFSTVMKDNRRTINLTPNNSNSGSRRSGSSGSGIDASFFTPPSLLRLYLSGNLRSMKQEEEEEPEPIEVETIQPEVIEILTPSEFLFEESIDLFRQKRYQSAGRNIQQLLEMNPGDSTKAAAYSLCLLAMRDYDDAAKWMMKAEDGMADNEDLYQLIQNIYAKKNEFSVHYKQLETKANSVQNVNTEFMLSVMHSVNERY